MLAILAMFLGMVLVFISIGELLEKSRESVPPTPEPLTWERVMVVIGMSRYLVLLFFSLFLLGSLFFCWGWSSSENIESSLGYVLALASLFHITMCFRGDVAKNIFEVNSYDVYHVFTVYQKEYLSRVAFFSLFLAIGIFA